jgi:cytochrome b pre-mRNA-processing protein 3
MLDFLFRRLTAAPERGSALFDWVTGLARAPHWYVEGKVPDTLNGRFAVLATVTALVLVRLEEEGERGDAASVALTERFIGSMEAEHRELGLGDPTLGKTVRRLVGSLARRTGRWRSAVSGETGWADTARESLYKTAVSPEALDHSASALRRLWTRLRETSLDDIGQGKLQ